MGDANLAVVISAVGLAILLVWFALTAIKKFRQYNNHPDLGGKDK